MKTNRKDVDEAVIKLWLAMNDLAEEMLTTEDLNLWDQVTIHSAVQDKLHEAIKKAPANYLK